MVKKYPEYKIKTSGDQIPEIEYTLEDAKKWLDDMKDGEVMTIEFNMVL